MFKGSCYSIIKASGRYIPPRVVKNEEFLGNEFFNSSGVKLAKTNDEIIRKFQEITEINERRYVEDKYVASDIAYFAALDAIKSSGIDKESLDYIIVSHNFGDVEKANPRADQVPSLGSKVKAKLGVRNPYTIAYDLPFGCPGFLQALIQADYYIKSGDAKRILVIGSETLSRVSDPHDIDSMIYSDGAGAIILEAVRSRRPVGIIAHKTRTDTLEHSHLLHMGLSYNPEFTKDYIFVKMNGRKLYEYALNNVPHEVKDCIRKAKLSIKDIKKVLIHQANAKMDNAILSRIFKLYNIKEIPHDIMPMTISELGNNSVATLPILYDLIIKKELGNHRFHKGDYLLLASVGAGMNVNVMVYRMPKKEYLAQK